MNSCNFIGRIGKDAETRFTQAGKAVCSWSIAIDQGWGDSKTTIWIDCSYWGERGEKVAEYIRKGERIGVSGEIGTREHNGKTYVTLRCTDVTLLGQKKDGDGQSRKPAAGKSNQARAPQRTTHDIADDDDSDNIPF